MRLNPRVFAGLAGLTSIVFTGVSPSLAQVATEVPPVVRGAEPVTVQPIQVHGASLEGNLEGNPVEREVIVFLPPSYRSGEDRRYPVVYALHGYSIGAEQWTHEIHVPQTIEGAFAQGAQEMIVVLPDSWTVHNGSMYSSSVTTGDFERFIAHDVVEYIDANYRTIPDRKSEESAGLPFPLRAQLAVAAAWSPNPKNPPLYLDLPWKDGVVQDDVLARWAANAPLAFVDQYVANLRRYDGIALDVGDEDGLRVDAGRLQEVLDRYGIAHDFEVYPGTHTSAVAVRFQNHVLPFFGRHLAGSSPPARSDADPGSMP